MFFQASNADEIRKKFTDDGVEIEQYGSVREEGVLNGVAYSIYDDGSGSIAGSKNAYVGRHSEDKNWRTMCHTDAMSDKKRCNARIHDLSITYYGKEYFVLCIGSDHYPRSSISIRLDSNKPLSSTMEEGECFSRKNSNSIIAKLKIAKLVTTRYVKWPYENNIDDTFELFGFNEVVQFLKWAHDRAQ
jgi:hypothetical protein